MNGHYGCFVINACRSVIFTNGTIEARLAALSKEKEQAKDRSSVITTQIQPLRVFHPAEPEHQVAIALSSSL